MDKIIFKALKAENIEVISDVHDLFDLMNVFAFQEVQNLEVWQIYSQSFLHHLMKENIDLSRLISAVIWFQSVSIRSIELYEMISSYFTYKKYTYVDFENQNNESRIIKFAVQFGNVYGQWDNQYFFEQLCEYFDRNYTKFDKFLTSRSLDTFKFFVNMKNDKVKDLLYIHLVSLNID